MCETVERLLGNPVLPSMQSTVMLHDDEMATCSLPSRAHKPQKLCCTDAGDTLQNHGQDIYLQTEPACTALGLPDLSVSLNLDTGRPQNSRK